LPVRGSCRTDSGMRAMLRGTDRNLDGSCARAPGCNCKLVAGGASATMEGGMAVRNCWGSAPCLFLMMLVLLVLPATTCRSASRPLAFFSTKVEPKG